MHKCSLLFSFNFLNFLKMTLQLLPNVHQQVEEVQSAESKEQSKVSSKVGHQTLESVMKHFPGRRVGGRLVVRGHAHQVGWRRGRGDGGQRAEVGFGPVMLVAAGRGTGRQTLWGGREIVRRKVKCYAAS